MWKQLGEDGDASSQADESKQLRSTKSVQKKLHTLSFTRIVSEFLKPLR